MTAPEGSVLQETSPREWEAWLDRLDAAAVDCTAQLDAGEAVLFPDVRRPAVGTPPAALVPRARTTLERINRLTSLVEQRRNGLAAQLSALPHPRRSPGSRQVLEQSLGSRLDLRG